MAQLKDTVVSGNLRVTDITLTGTIQTTTVNAPTSSGGTSYGPGTNGQFIRSNGTSSYWGSLAATDIPALNYVPNTQAGMSAAINLLGVGTSNPQLGDYYVAQYAGGGTTTNSYHRRPVSALWNTFKGLITIDTTGSGNAITAASIANDGNNRKITFTKGTTFSTTDTKVTQNILSTSDSNDYPLLLSNYNTSSTTTTAATTNRCADIYANASIGYLKANYIMASCAYRPYVGVLNTDSQEGIILTSTKEVYDDPDSTSGTITVTMKGLYIGTGTGPNLNPDDFIICHMHEHYSDGGSDYHRTLLHSNPTYLASSSPGPYIGSGDHNILLARSSTCDTRELFHSSGLSAHDGSGSTTNTGYFELRIGNSIPMGTGGNMEGRIYLYGPNSTGGTIKVDPNVSSNEWVLPPASGTLCIADGTGSATQPVYISGNKTKAVTQPTSGAWFSSVPNITSGGAINIGRYIDFHATNTSTNDYDVRFDASSTSLVTLIGNSGNAIMCIAGTAPTLRLKQTTSGKEYDSASIWTRPANTNGSQLFIQSGGITMIGSGEFCTNALARKDANNETVVGFDNIVTTNVGAEKMYIGSDADVKIIANGQNIGTYNNNDHKVWEFETTGELLTPGIIKDSLSTQHTMIAQSVRSSGNSVVLAKWIVDGAASTTYTPHISFYNMGGDATDKGAITLLPYHSNTSPWGGTIGLYIGKNILKLDNHNVLHTGNTSVSTSTVSGATTIKSIKINNTNYNIYDSGSTLYFTTAGTKWGRVASLVTTKQSTYVMLLSVSQGMLAETSSSHNKGAGILQIACNTSSPGTVGSNNTAAMWLVAGGNISAANFVLIGYNNSKYASDGKQITSQSGSAVFELWVKNTANYHIWCIKTLQELYTQNVGSYFTFYNLTDSDAVDNRPTTGSVTKTSTFMIPVTS